MTGVGNVALAVRAVVLLLAVGCLGSVIRFSVCSTHKFKQCTLGRLKREMAYSAVSKIVPHSLVGFLCTFPD